MKIKGIQVVMAMALGAVMLGAAGCESSTQHSRSTGERWDDRRVARDVRRELNRDSLTKNADIDVESFRGHVSLRGFVDYPQQKQVALSIARSVNGVQWVKDNMIVKDTLPTARMMTEAAGAQNNPRWHQGATR